MTHQIEDNVQEVTTQASAGSGALTLNGAADARKRTFQGAGFVDGDTFWGRVENPNAAEYQNTLWTYAAGAVTPSWVAGKSTSSTGALVAFSAGVKTVTLVEYAGRNVRKKRTITSGTATAMNAGDFELEINKAASAAHAVTLPPNPTDGQECVVSDGKGDLDFDGGGTVKITVAGAAGNINGQATHVMQAAYQSTRYRYSATGGQWNIVA